MTYPPTTRMRNAADILKRRLIARIGISICSVESKKKQLQHCLVFRRFLFGKKHEKINAMMPRDGKYEIEPYSLPPDKENGMRVRGSESHTPPEQIFRWYAEDFGLSKEGLKDKVVLDLGSGDEAGFADYCNKNRIAKTVYSADRSLFLERFPGTPWKSKKAYDDYKKY